VRRGLLVLLLAAAALAQDADHGIDALRARIEALRPDVEASLGAPLGDAVEVLVTTPGALRDLLVKEFAAQRAQISGGPRGEELLKTCTQEATLVSRFLLAKVDLGSGTIHVCPENFRSIAGLDASWKGILAQDALDAVLLHEMVHVFQMRRFDLARFVGAPPSIEQLIARSSVIEGHAQYVGRMAAKRRGLDAASGLIDRAQTEVPASIEDPAMRHLTEVLAANFAFAYVEGEKFVGAVVGKLGYEEAAERIFASPPETLRAVSNPGEYLDPPAAGTSLDGIASQVQRLLVERGGTAQIMPLPLPALRAALMPAGEKVVESALRGFDKGIAVVSPGDPQVVVGLMRGRDEEAAKLLYEADIATSKAKDVLFGKPGSQIRILAAAYRPLPFEGADGIEAVKTVQMALVSNQRVDSVIVRRGALVIEAMVVNASAPGQGARLAREVLELLRGADVVDPWDGKKGEEAKASLLAALRDPHWGVRWRAMRNLARMKEDPEIGAALVRMLKDPDASVSCDALRALVRRGWLGRATPEDRDALASHADWEVRLAYERTMAEHETDKEATTSRLLAALKDVHPAIRAYAFGKLDDLNTRDRIPWELSRAGIEDPDADVRLAAFGALRYVGLPPDARPALLKALRDENPEIRSAAAIRLDQWAKESPEVVEALIAALGDESESVRRHAASGLAGAGRAAAPALPALCRLLDNESGREAAAEALGEIGIADPEVLRKLEGFADAADLGFRFEVARALRRLGRDPKDLMPVFLETLRKGKDRYRRMAAEELGNLGEAARSHVADLATALKDESTGVRREAAEALGKMGEAAGPQVADLVAALKDKELRVREEAAEALGSLGAVAEEALPVLEALGGEEEEPFELDEDGNPVIGLGGDTTERDVRHAAREAAKKIRAALAKPGR
jgi:HEAT repeat protein